MPKRKRASRSKPLSAYTSKRPMKRKKRISVAGRVKRVENLVNKTIENKHVDYQATSTPGDQIYAASPISKLAFIRMSGVGAGESLRVGDKVTLMSQRFMMNLIKGDNSIHTDASGNSYVLNNDQQVRILIVQNVGFDSSTDLQLTDVLEYGLWSTDSNTVFTSPYKIGADSTKRYRVLYDKVFHLHNERPFAKVDFAKKYGTKTNPGKVLSYENDTADFPNNHRINVFAISDYVTGSYPPQLSILARSKYKDA